MRYYDCINKVIVNKQNLLIKKKQEKEFKLSIIENKDTHNDNCCTQRLNTTQHVPRKKLLEANETIPIEKPLTSKNIKIPKSFPKLVKYELGKANKLY